MRERRLRAAELRTVDSFLPRSTRRKGKFDYAKLKQEVAPFVQVKIPKRISAKWRTKLVKLGRELVRRKIGGNVYYPVRSKRNLEAAKSLFPDKVDWKGVWIPATKSQFGHAKLTFPKSGKPRLTFVGKKGAKITQDFVLIDGKKFLKNPAKYILSLNLDPNKPYFPAFGREGAYGVSSRGAKLAGKPTLMEVLETLEYASNQPLSKGRLFALVTYDYTK